MMKSCNNCFWHCHSNGRCYVDPRSARDDDYSLKVVMATACTDWQFDGLEDWERESCDALVTVEVM